VITPTGHESSNDLKLKIQPGDTIVVPERTFSRAEIVQLIMGGAALVLSGVAIVVTTVKR
jgi:hypothetical protein